MSRKSPTPNVKSPQSQSSELMDTKSLRSSGNRRFVVVEQQMLKIQYTPEKSCGEEKDPSHARLLGASSPDSWTDCHVLSTNKQSFDDRTILSSPEGSSSSHCSIVSSGYNASNTSVICTTNIKVLDELKTDVETTAVQFMKFQSEIEEIPKLKIKIKDIEKEKNIMSDDISEKSEIIQAMKQRLSVLHEQNSQLAQLTKSPLGGSSETLKIRNALVASLAQIKKLQMQADELPELKMQISALRRENAGLREHEELFLKQFSINVPAGIMPQDYNTLMEDNAKLKISNDNLSADIKSVLKNVDLLSSSIESLGKRIDNFEKSALTSIPLMNHIKRLEKDKEELSQQLIELKLNKSIPHDLDAAFLYNECAILCKNNSLLQTRLDSLATNYRQQKESIILKLLGIELSNVQTQTLEVQKYISDIQCINTHELATVEDGTSLTPHFKSQILKLHQVRLQSEQSQNIMQMILSEKEELEKKVIEFKDKLDVKYVRDLEYRVEDYKNRLVVTYAKITDLEKRLLNTAQSAGSNVSTIVTENIILKPEAQIQSAALVELQRFKEEKQSHEAILQKYKKVKAQKNKLGKKLHENKDRFQVIAGELSNSAELLEKYQIKCSELEKGMEESSAEKVSLRNDIAILRAEIEIMKTEHSYDPFDETYTGLEDIHMDSREANSEGEKQLHLLCTETTDTRIVEYNKQIQALSEENHMLKQRFEEEVGDAQRKIKFISTELIMLEEKFKCVSYELKESKTLLATLRGRQHTISDKETVKIAQLEEEKEKISGDYELIIKSKELLMEELSLLEEDKLKLSLELRGVMCNCDDLHIELKRVEEVNHRYLKQLHESELRISGLLTDIDNCQCEKAELITALSAKKADISAIVDNSRLKDFEIEKYKQKIQTLHESMAQDDRRKGETLNQNELVKQSYLQLEHEIEGYKAIIKSLQRRLDEAETREIEHECLRHKMKMLEKSFGDSSYDNKALLKLIQEAMKGVPSLLTQPEQSLQDRNLQLEEQISVLSQWNDKQRQEIEQLEILLDKSSNACEKLSMEVKLNSEFIQENIQLKRELKEVEIEVNALRRQMRADMQEELHIKVEAQTQLLAVFNQHNILLQNQVEELLSQLKILGGQPNYDKAVSPPPMPDVTLFLSSSSLEDHGPRCISDLEKENILLRQRIKIIEDELKELNSISTTVRRHSSTIYVILSVPIGAINENILIKVPSEMLLPCSLLADHLNLSDSLDDSVTQSWVDVICKEWFSCMSQKALTPACAQCYIATLSNLSYKLLDIVINLQDEKGNTALHYIASNGNFPVIYQFIKLKSCDPHITNMSGYNPLMLISAYKMDHNIDDYRETLDTLIERTDVDAVATKDQRTALMLAASSGNSNFVDLFLEKGCNVNAIDEDGSTALMFAAQCKHEDIVQILLSTSICDTQAKDNEGHTARDIAKSCKYPAISSLLKRTNSKH